MFIPLRTDDYGKIVEAVDAHSISWFEYTSYQEALNLDLPEINSFKTKGNRLKILLTSGTSLVYWGDTANLILSSITSIKFPETEKVDLKQLING